MFCTFKKWWQKNCQIVSVVAVLFAVFMSPLFFAELGTIHDGDTYEAISVWGHYGSGDLVVFKKARKICNWPAKPPFTSCITEKNGGLISTWYMAGRGIAGRHVRPASAKQRMAFRHFFG